MNVLLISANTERINMPVLPLGMAYVAAAAEHAGHAVKTVNLMMAKGLSATLTAVTAGFVPDVIGISVRNIDDQVMEAPKFLLESVKTVMAECRSLSDAPIVIGGAGYSIFPQSVLDYLKADMGIQGEGERAFVVLLERIKHKQDFYGIPGLYLPKSGLQAKRRFTRSMDDHPQPLPNVHLHFPAAAGDEDVWLPIQTRRGCPMDCSYCSTATIEGRTIKKHSVEKAVTFLRRFAAAGFKKFFFVDNTFNLPVSYAKALCDRIVSSGLTIEWRCILYPWQIDDELVEKMAQAGCRQVSLGFESGCTPILKRLNKRFEPEDVRRISRLLGKYKIQRLGFLLLGGPGETRDTVERSLAFADSLGLEAMKITTGIRVYPHTRLHRIAVEEGVVARNDDLLFPKFYVSSGLQGWLAQTVNRWLAHRPNWNK